MPQQKARRVILECEHERWFQRPYPNVNDEIWCPQCGTMQRAGLARIRVNRTLHLDGCWLSIPPPIGYSRYRGECQGKDMEGDCDHAETDRNWYRLRDKMESHYLHKHTNSVLAGILSIDVEIPRRLPP